MFETTPKMLAKNYFADIMGINLEYALEAYGWQGFYPMKDNGITVTPSAEITALVPIFCGRDYGRDVVPLNPAIREANRRN